MPILIISTTCGGICFKGSLTATVNFNDKGKQLDHRIGMRKHLFQDITCDIRILVLQLHVLPPYVLNLLQDGI